MYSYTVRGGLLACLAGLLIACSGGSEPVKGTDEPNPPPETTFSISGTVGNSSLVDADVTATADGQSAAATSDDAAGYSVTLDEGTAMPVRLTATGGRDLVTGQPARFELAALTFANRTQTVNVSPLTTLATHIAECADTLSENTHANSWDRIEAALAMGLSPTIDPLGDALTAGNAAQLMLANEAFREAVRRTVRALASAGQPVADDEVIRQVGCDLWQGGHLDGDGDGVNARLIATFRAAEASVLLETIAHRLHVDDQNVMALLDAALVQVTGASVSVSDVLVSHTLVAQARAALTVFLRAMNDPELLDLALHLDGPPVTVTQDITNRLGSGPRAVLAGLAERVALADASVLADLVDRMAAQPVTAAPILSFDASSTTVANGERVTLSWATANADRCHASDGWAGEVSLDGAFTTNPLTRTTTYVVECVGLGGTTEASVRVTVTNPDPAPAVTLTAADTTIDAGDSTTLNWSSSNATSCQASGAWSGSRQTSGSQATGALDETQTYTLTCSGSGGSASATVTVTVNAPPNTDPTVTLSAADAALDAGDSTTLTWSATNVSTCQASGAWSGSRATSGSQSTGALNQAQTYTLTCTGPAGSDTASVTVNIRPTVTISAAPATVDSGDSTTLTWSSTQATGCTASGGWSGSRATSGSQLRGPLTASTTFSLTCAGPGGNAVAMIEVQVNGTLSLSWVAPTENVDGTPLTDLAGFRIYYGSSSRNYTGQAAINDPAATQHTFTLPSGSYYVAMTAVDGDGNESAYSNEVLKSTQ